MDDLSGTYVLVHPGLHNDSVQQQGQTGMITSADLERNDIYVSFGKGLQGLYAADALLVMQNHQDIHANAVANYRGLDPRDFKTLLDISRLQRDGSPAEMRNAIQLAVSNETVRTHSMVSLQQKLGLGLDHSVQLQHPGALSR